MIDKAIKSTGGVPSNYAILLAGIFFFPIQIVAMSFSRSRRYNSDDWERSHYEMQYRTALVFLIAEAGLFVIGALSVFTMSGARNGVPGSPPILWIVLNYAGGAALIWLVVRSVRGLFLAGAKAPLIHPTSYTIWPR